MRIAEEHAANAAKAGDLRTVKKELQQALNCLVGRGGTAYRADVGDPCHGMGASHKLPNQTVNRIRVKKARNLADVGVTFHDFKPAHFTALVVQAVLEEGTR
jgi:hypothetical protein